MSVWKRALDCLERCSCLSGKGLTTIGKLLIAVWKGIHDCPERGS